MQSTLGSPFIRRVSRAACSAAILGVAVAAAPAVAASHGASSWLKWNAASKTANLTLVAASSAAGNGFNFNGYANGKLVVKVPVGAKVHVTFRNASATVPHSAMIVTYASRTSTSLTPAFPGATTANAMSGVAKGKTQHFTFTASKKGKYAIVCGVPGHAPAGMWDVLSVTAGGMASISVK